MKHIRTAQRRSEFKVLAQTRLAQAAMMVLGPKGSTGEPQNEHSKSEQWLYVISGRGRAKVGNRRVSLAAGSLLLIEKGEVHQIVNTGTTPLTTLNFYAPPAYTPSGEVRPSQR